MQKTKIFKPIFLIPLFFSMLTSWGSMSLARLTQAENDMPSQILVTAKQVVAGYVSTCAITDAGGVKCWGRNDVGQLGNNSVEDSGTPVDVIGLNSGVNSIAVGYKHACALTSTGGVKCWGLNRSGQLGNNSTTDAKTPVDAVGLTSGVRAITAGWEHTCALMSAGGVKCWGQNGFGQLGNNSTENSKTPVDVATLGSGVSFVVTKGDFTCAITNLGAAKCWGDNASGQLGNNSTSTAKTPVDVATLSSAVSSIAVTTFEACAILTTGVVKCWGGYGENAGETFGSKTPVEVPALSGKMTTLVGTVNNLCGITKTSALQCWGSNYAGQLGNGERTNRETPKETPAEVIGLGSGVTAASGGWGHICAIANASLKCWGANDSGQVGNGRMASSALPIPVVGISGDTNAIGGGGFHVCAATPAGGLRCWGGNWAGQIGADAAFFAERAVPMAGLTGKVIAIAGSVNHTCVVIEGGAVKCWGANDSGELGNDSTTQTAAPVDVKGLNSGVRAISIGSGDGYGGNPFSFETHVCALTTAGGVKCWGANAFGELGNNSRSNSSVPVDVTGLSSGVSAIAAGREHSCAVTTVGGVKCWGGNGAGQLGLGSTSVISSAVPVDVPGLSGGVRAIAAGLTHTCAVLTTGAAKCWGGNEAGQLGNNSTTDAAAPVDVAGLSSGVSAIVAGWDHTCAVLASGGAKCWGANDFGKLGNGSSVASLTPVDVAGLGSDVKALTLGMGHTCALVADGVKCWGWNQQGQLGSGMPWHLTQQMVAGFAGPRQYLALLGR